MTALILSAAMATLAPSNAPTAPNELSIAQQVHEYASRHIGARVGSGECADLNYYGLEVAGARPFGTWQDQPAAGDYVWGRKIATLTPNFEAEDLAEQLIPGDMLQFRNVKIVEKVGRVTYTTTATHHSAVLDAFDASSGKLTIFEQNSGGKRYVTRRTFRVADIQAGSIWVYRPQPKL